VAKRTIIITIMAVAAILIVAITVPPLFDSPPQIADKAVGTWQEIGQTPAYTMQVTHAFGLSYLVTYPRWEFVAEGFQLQGEELRGGGGENNMNDAVKTITYDGGADELTISDTSGDHPFAFSRVSP
jgi:hypothetical protein